MKEPFHTQNRQLALALITCGCEWLSQAEGGPTINTYTPSLLRSKGLLASHAVPLEQFEQAALEAVRAKVPGSVSFFFVRTRKLEAAIQAWDDNAALLQSCERWEQMGEEERAEHPELKPERFPAIPDATVMQVLNFHANNTRKEKLDQFIFANPAICSTIGGSYTPAAQPKTATEMPAGVTKGGGKAWSVTLNNEDRKHMGIHPRIK